jgi:DNA repair exonuclease SbcCD ATPase subunit
MSDDQVAVHPVWGSDNEAIKAEFRTLQAECDKWKQRFDRCDLEAERHAHEAEARIKELEEENEALLEILNRVRATNEDYAAWYGQDKARLKAADELADFVERAFDRMPPAVLTAYREASK